MFKPYARYVCYALYALLFLVSSQVFAQTDIAQGKTATASSALQPAANAVDGNTGSRWESTHGVDPSWIMVDLVTQTTITSVAIDWEAANAADYQIQGSNDTTNWTSLASRTGMTFGARTDTLAVTGSYRYVRMYGTKRSTGNAWGYSIYSFKLYGAATSSVASSSASTSSKSSSSKPSSSSTPSSIATSSSSASSKPSSSVTSSSIASSVSSTQSTDYVPLFNSSTQVLEQTQYTEVDGTLVTTIGFRPTPRHAKEGGEPFADTVDQGPGRYLEFSPFYFQNRTFGLIIRDEVPAGRQKITAYLKPNNGIMINNSFNAFHRLDPGVIEYGWKLGTGYTNQKDGTERCGPSDKITELCVANIVISDYWRFQDDKDYQGITRTDNKLKIGDKIEMTAGVFLDYLPGTTVALIDGGFNRDYSLEHLYVVGKGVVPWYGIAPMLDSTPLPDKALLGGLASVSYNYSEEPHRLLQQSAANIGAADMQRFVEGRRLFHTSFIDGKHSENPDVNPVFTAHANQLGPRYNEIRCLGCHTLNGSSPAPAIGATLNKFAVLTAAASTSTSITPDPTYGFNVQQLTSAGGPDYSVKVAGYQTSTRTLAGGEQVQLQTPVYSFAGPVPAQVSVRQAPQVIGMGLLEAVDEKTILAFADPNDLNSDGIRGIPNWSIDPVTGQKHLGRFGWKAGKGSIRQQIAGAFMLDMGVTTSMFKTRDCQRGLPSCKTATDSPSISDAELDRLTNYMELLGVPAQRSIRSPGFTNGWVVPPEHAAIDEVTIERGSQLFASAQCTSCHITEMKTGANDHLQELRNQVIHPYTDLLLHDMGPELADTMTEGQASPQMWRTSPLWGLGSLKYALGLNADGKPSPENVRYLHDGRARTLVEAIEWHGGEGSNSRVKFEAMSKADRTALTTFLESL